MKRLQQECGVTRISLQNGRVLQEEHGFPCWVRLLGGHDPLSGNDPAVEVGYPDGHHHRFTGFAFGYGGEGPHGLATWAAANRVPLTVETIQALPFRGKGTVWRWPSVYEVWQARSPSFSLTAVHPEFSSEKYELVARVECQHLGEAFELTNTIDHPWWENEGVEVLVRSRSTSVGDVIVDPDGQRHRCEPVGWSTT